jgi:hypothetical protein
MSQAFQHLIELELVTLVEQHVDGLLFEYQMVCMRIPPDAVIQALETSEKISCPTGLL